MSATIKPHQNLQITNLPAVALAVIVAVLFCQYERKKKTTTGIEQENSQAGKRARPKVWPSYKR